MYAGVLQCGLGGPDPAQRSGRTAVGPAGLVRLVGVLLAACRVRMSDGQALARAGSGLAARDLSDARRFVALRGRHEPAAVRAAAVRDLVALGARSELAAALRDPAAAVCYAGLRALGQSTRELCRRDARRL